jgi:hypothetical protein
MKNFMRWFYALLPAVFWSLIFLMVDWRIALFLFVGLAYIGIALTSPKPERGEGSAN